MLSEFVSAPFKLFDFRGSIQPLGTLDLVKGSPLQVRASRMGLKPGQMQNDLLPMALPGGRLPTRPGPPPKVQTTENPTGLTDQDPIPMTWYKPLKMYPTSILMPKDRKGNTIKIRMFPHRDVDGLEIGVDSWPHEGFKVRKNPAARGGGEKRFAAELNRFGCVVDLPMEGRRRKFDYTDIDHVVDLFWGGADNATNLWPLESATNQLAGSKNNSQPVTWAYRRDTPARETTLAKVPNGRWFVIRDILPPR